MNRRRTGSKLCPAAYGLAAALATSLAPGGTVAQAQLSPSGALALSDDNYLANVKVQRFGESVASGDFNCDGRLDLAIGAPGADVTFVGSPTIVDAGVVFVFYAIDGGYDVSTPLILLQSGFSLEDGVEDFDEFGWTLASGDFDHDTCADLAIGVPGENLTVGGTEYLNAGVVNWALGDAEGLGRWVRSTLTPGTASVLESNANYGWSLATGSFNEDLYGDLAIGIPGQTVSGNARAGAVEVRFGASSGIGALTTPPQYWHQDIAGVLGTASPQERFGEALAAARFGEGPVAPLPFVEDLAIGVPYDLGSGSAAGSVNVLYASGGELSASGSQLWHRNVQGIEGDAVAGDRFGSALAVGDFESDGRTDLAIGVPGADSGRGQVHFLLGASQAGWQGLAEPGDSILEIPCACGCPATDLSGFGAVLATGDFDGQLGTDLVIGMPNLNAGGTDAGAICSRYRAGTATAYHLLSQQLVGGQVPGTGDQFGFALARGRLDFNYILAVGVPGEVLTGSRTGRVVVLRTPYIFKDGFASGSTANWSSVLGVSLLPRETSRHHLRGASVQ